jgi:CBS domain-containing protein
MKVLQIMTASPITVAAEAELDRAMALMDGKDLRHLPVVEDDKLVGVVSDRDLLEATGWLYSDRRRQRFEPSDEGRARTVRDVMRAPPITVDVSDTVFTVAVKFVVDRIGCLPVLENGTLSGIVTETDLLKTYERACEQDLVPPERNVSVSEPMTGTPVTVSWHTPLDEAEEITRQSQVRHLPVLEGDTVVGMVSDRDLRKARGLNRVDDTMMEEIMTKGVVTITPEQTLREAAQLMVTRAIGALPVVDGEALIGIVSIKDLVYHCMSNLRETEATA